MDTIPFHAGELAAQSLAGESERALANGRAIGVRIVPGALKFVGEQPFLLAASVDRAGRPWAVLVAGEPGFARAPAPDEIEVDGARVTYAPAELFDDLRADARIGLLFIEPVTRRRLRVNGRAEVVGERGLRVRVEQAFPNCPKYVRRRAFALAPANGTPGVPTRGRELLPALAERIRRADVFFAASAGPDGGLDVSHRGGERGFVELLPDGRLLVPDYPGNSMFNTFGNLLHDPRAGLVFPDFEDGGVLRLTGRAQVDFEGAAAEPTLGTRRSWTFAPDEWRFESAALPFRLLRVE